MRVDTHSLIMVRRDAYRVAFFHHGKYSYLDMPIESHSLNKSTYILIKECKSTYILIKETLYAGTKHQLRKEDINLGIHLHGP